MSVTVVTSPDTHTPAYNDQYFVLTSTLVAQTNFAISCAIDIDGTTVATLIVPPDSVTSKMYINAQRIVEGYVTNYFEPSNIEPKNEYDSTYGTAIRKVTCTFSERYGTTPVTYTASASGVYYVWNAAYPAVDFKSYAFSVGGGASGRVLNKGFTSGSYRSTTILYAQHFYVSWHRAFSSVVFDHVRVTSYDIGNNLIQNATMLNNYSAIGGNFERNLQYMDVSPTGCAAYLVAYAGGVTRSNGALPIIPTSTAYYLITYENAANTQGSETYKVTIDDFCSSYSKYSLHFLNSYGAYDTFVFNKLSRKTSKARKSEYKALPFSLNSSNDYTYTTYTDTQKQYSTVITNSITLNSDWINDEKATWLKDLIYSPSIYIEDTSGVLRAVKITDSSYEEKMKVNDKVFNLTVNLDYALEDVRQRG